MAIRRFGGTSAVADHATHAILAAVDKGVTSRWEPAQRRAAAAKGATRDERVREVDRMFRRELTAAGALAGGAAAVPGAGTAAAVGASIVELGLVTTRFADLILTIAVLHGHDRASVEERRAWVLSILAFGNGAAAGFTKLAAEVGKGVGAKATTRLPTTALRAVNAALGRTVITKYGTKRGVVAVGRALPAGVGAAIGGTANYLMVRGLARQSDRFFALLGNDEPG